MSSQSEKERKAKTWVILDPTNFASVDSAEIDLFGAQVLWGDQD